MLSARGRSRSVFILEPQPQSSDEPRSARVFAGSVREVRGLTPFVVPGDADIRRKLAPDLIAQTESKVGGTEACADTAFRIRFTEEFCLEERLQHEAIRE